MRMGELRRQFEAYLAECHFLAVNVVREDLEDFLFTKSLNREATRALGKRCNPQDGCDLLLVNEFFYHIVIT